MKNPQAQLQRDELYWHYPFAKPHFLGGRSSGAIRKGDWKPIEFFDTGQRELYNLAEDISEKNNLAAENPDKAAELGQLLARWRRKVGARPDLGNRGSNHEPPFTIHPFDSAQGGEPVEPQPGARSPQDNWCGPAPAAN